MNRFGFLLLLHHDLFLKLMRRLGLFACPAGRPCKIPDFGLLCDLVWSDPEPDTMGWGISDRGVSYTFGNDILNKMCKSLDIDLVCRAHQVVEDVYDFECNRKIVVCFFNSFLLHYLCFRYVPPCLLPQEADAYCVVCSVNACSYPGCSRLRMLLHFVFCCFTDNLLSTALLWRV